MTTDAAPSPVKRRWKRRVIVGGVLLLLVALLAAWWIVVSPHWRLAAIVAELDATDPHWRLAEIEQRRAAVPDDENSALFMLALAKKAGRIDVYDGFGVYDKIFKAERLPPVQLNAQQVRYLQKHFAKLGAALHEARKLKDMPRGRYPIEYSENGIDTHHECQIARSFIDLFMHDGFLLAHEGKIDEALDAALCCLNCGRSVGDEPLLSSFLIRFALTLFVYHNVERALAQGEASERALEKLQTELQAEDQQHRLPAAMRGERAAIHELCKSIQKGTTDPNKLRRLPAKGKPSFVEWLREKVPHDVVQGHADLLREWTLSIEASKAPLHELIPRMDAREKEFAARANTFAVQFATATKKVTQVEVRRHAILRCAYTALACERYRLQHKDWPASLDVLVEAKLLDTVPDDPFDGKPLRYLRTNEGVTIYSVGYDLADNQGKIDSSVPFFTPGYDIGIRLWNVPLRRQPPLPLVPLAPEDE